MYNIHICIYTYISKILKSFNPYLGTIKYLGYELGIKGYCTFSRNLWKWKEEENYTFSDEERKKWELEKSVSKARATHFRDGNSNVGSLTSLSLYVCHTVSILSMNHKPESVRDLIWSECAAWAAPLQSLQLYPKGIPYEPLPTLYHLLALSPSLLFLFLSLFIVSILVKTKTLFEMYGDKDLEKWLVLVKRTSWA